MAKSPLGIIFAAAAITLAVSPKARQAVRKLAVKGAGLLLELTDEIKHSTAGHHQSTVATNNEEQNTE